MTINQKIPLDECLVEYRNDNGQIYMRFEDGTVLRLAEASQRSEPGTRRELVRDKIEAVARLWYASEPDKGLRERLTEGLIDKMTAAVLPALMSERKLSRDEVLDEVKAMLEEQRQECLDETSSMSLNRIRADELDTALINLRALRAEASQRNETGARELTSRECFETYRNLVWTVQEADGMNRGWVEFARRLNEIVQFRPTQAGSETPAPRDLQRTAGDVIREFRESGSQDWGQLESAVNWWAWNQFLPSVAPRASGEAHKFIATHLPNRPCCSCGWVCNGRMTECEEAWNRHIRAAQTTPLPSEGDE